MRDAKKLGIKYEHSIMDNGEKRFRQLCLKDNTAYIRAEGKKVGYWQKSHFHQSIKEIYIVQNGSVLVALYINNKVKIEKYNEYDVFKIEPKIPHNIYMYPNAVLHTVKYGKVREYDWEPFEKLDEILNSKPIEEIEKSYIIK
ncbi:MAG TPA: hypothetical protein OIM45_08740 [Clostridiaceae bacterium]|nr:hypothetical protein [Clostridiaceae bacterium]